MLGPTCNGESQQEVRQGRRSKADCFIAGGAETPISKLRETETKSDGFAAKVYISSQDGITKYFMQAGNISLPVMHCPIVNELPKPPCHDVMFCFYTAPQKEVITLPLSSIGPIPTLRVIDLQ